MTTITYVVDVNGDVVGHSTQRSVALVMARKAMRDANTVLQNRHEFSVNIIRVNENGMQVDESGKEVKA